MKENILKIVKELSRNNYFNDCTVSLTINYNNEIKNYNELLFIKSLSEIHKVVNKYDVIEGYNLTLYKKSGDIFGNDIYVNTDITFWSGNDESSKNINPLKYGMFEWRTSSDCRESSNPNGIRHYLAKRIYDEEHNDEKHNIKYGNFFKYDNVKELINSLVELDLLFDKQYKEKRKIYDKIKLYLND